MNSWFSGISTEKREAIKNRTRFITSPIGFQFVLGNVFNDPQYWLINNSTDCGEARAVKFLTFLAGVGFTI